MLYTDLITSPTALSVTHQAVLLYISRSFSSSSFFPLSTHKVKKNRSQIRGRRWHFSFYDLIFKPSDTIWGTHLNSRMLGVACALWDPLHRWPVVHYKGLNTTVTQQRSNEKVHNLLRGRRAKTSRKGAEVRTWIQFRRRKGSPESNKSSGKGIKRKMKKTQKVETKIWKGHTFIKMLIWTPKALWALNFRPFWGTKWIIHFPGL